MGSSGHCWSYSVSTPEAASFVTAATPPHLTPNTLSEYTTRTALALQSCSTARQEQLVSDTDQLSETKGTYPQGSAERRLP